MFLHPVIFQLSLAIKEFDYLVSIFIFMQFQDFDSIILWTKLFHFLYVLKLELLVFFTRRQVGENQRLWGRLIKPLREGRYAAVVLFAKAIILGKLQSWDVSA